MSLLNLLILICYKRVINRTVFCEFIESIDFDLLQKLGQCFVSLLNLLILICYKRVIKRTEFSEFIESIDFDLLQKSDK